MHTYISYSNHYEDADDNTTWSLDLFLSNNIKVKFKKF